MKTLYTKFIVLPLILITPIIALTSNSVLFSWMLMEIGTMSFIFLITLNNMYTSKWSAALMYFIIQALASALLIPSLLMSNSLLKMSLIINIILMMKLGLSPFHSWVPWMMNNLSWFNCLIMTTIQKIIPLVLLSKFKSPNFIFLTSIMSVLVASLTIIKSSTLKKIMSYSSISNSGWMIFLLNTNFNLMIMFLIIYTINCLAIFIILDKLNLNLLSDFNKFSTSMNWMFKVYFTFLFLSLAGLPPFMGFLLKLITTLSFKLNSLLLTIIIILSLLNLYSYLVVCWNMMFIMEPSVKLWTNPLSTNWTPPILALPLISFWVFSPLMNLL